MSGGLAQGLPLSPLAWARRAGLGSVIAQCDKIFELHRISAHKFARRYSIIFFTVVNGEMQTADGTPTKKAVLLQTGVVYCVKRLLPGSAELRRSAAAAGRVEPRFIWRKALRAALFDRQGKVQTASILREFPASSAKQGRAGGRTAPHFLPCPAIPCHLHRHKKAGVGTALSFYAQKRTAPRTDEA